LEYNYGNLIDFLSKISNLSHFTLLHLADVLMHHYFPVAFFDVATVDLRQYSYPPVPVCLQYVHHSELRHWQLRRIDHNGSHKPVSVLRDAGEWGH